MADLGERRQDRAERLALEARVLACLAAAEAAELRARQDAARAASGPVIDLAARREARAGRAGFEASADAVHAVLSAPEARPVAVPELEAEAE